MNIEMLCVVCGQPTPIHVAASDLYRTGVCVVRCEPCALACHEAFDRWQASQMGTADDPDLEKTDDRYAQEMDEQRRKNMPKYSEVK